VGLGVGWFMYWTKSAAGEREMQAEIKLHKDVKFAAQFWQGVLSRQLDEARAKVDERAKATALQSPLALPTGTTETAAPGFDPFAQ